MKENKEIEKCVITVKELSEDEKMERLQFLREKAIRDEHSIELYGYKRGLEKGVDKGKAEGEKKGRLKIAKKLLKEGKDIKYISELTEIDEEELKKLK